MTDSKGANNNINRDDDKRALKKGRGSKSRNSAAFPKKTPETTARKKSGKRKSPGSNNNKSPAPKVTKMDKGGATIALDRRVILRKLKKARQHYRGLAGEEEAGVRWGGEKELKRGTAVALAHLELIEAWLVYNVASNAGAQYIPVYGKRKLTGEEKSARQAAASKANVAFDKSPSADGIDLPAVKAIIMEMSAFRSPSTPSQKYDALLSNAPLHEKAESILAMRKKMTPSFAKSDADAESNKVSLRGGKSVVDASVLIKSWEHGKLHDKQHELYASENGIEYRGTKRKKKKHGRKANIHRLREANKGRRKRRRENGEGDGNNDNIIIASGEDAE